MTASPSQTSTSPTYSSRAPAIALALAMARALDAYHAARITLTAELRTALAGMDVAQLHDKAEEVERAVAGITDMAAVGKPLANSAPWFAMLPHDMVVDILNRDREVFPAQLAGYDAFMAPENNKAGYIARDAAPSAATRVRLLADAERTDRDDPTSPFVRWIVELDGNPVTGQAGNAIGFASAAEAADHVEAFSRVLLDGNMRWKMSAEHHRAASRRSAQIRAQIRAEAAAAGHHAPRPMVDTDGQPVAARMLAFVRDVMSTSGAVTRTALNRFGFSDAEIDANHTAIARQVHGLAEDTEMRPDQDKARSAAISVSGDASASRFAAQSCESDQTKVPSAA